MKNIVWLFLFACLFSMAQISTKCAVCPPTLRGVSNGSVLRDSSGYARWQSIAGFDTTAIGVDSLGKLYWKTTGNSGTNSSTNFIGTTDGTKFRMVSGYESRDAATFIEITRSNETQNASVNIYARDSVMNHTLAIDFSGLDGALVFQTIDSTGAEEASKIGLYTRDSITLFSSKIILNSPVIINDGTQANGYVYTSNAQGVGSWQSLLEADYSGLPQYANNAAALSGGRAVGKLYIDNSYHLLVVHP